MGQDKPVTDAEWRKYTREHARSLTEKVAQHRRERDTCTCGTAGSCCPVHGVGQ